MDQASVAPVDSTELSDATISSDNSHPKRGLAIYLAIVLLIGICVGAIATFTAFQQGLFSGLITTNRPAPSATPTPKPSVTPTPSPASQVSIPSNWRTFTASDKSWSFRYPPTWSIDTKLVSNTADPAASGVQLQEVSLSANGRPVVEFAYPFEFTGCNQKIVYRAYQVGEWPTILTASCDNPMYLAFFEAPMKDRIPSAPNMLLAYHYSTQVDKDFRQVASSIEGLTTLVSCIVCNGK